MWVGMCSPGYECKYFYWELCLVWTFKGMDTVAFVDCWSPYPWVAFSLFFGYQFVRDHAELGR